MASDLDTPWTAKEEIRASPATARPRRRRRLRASIAFVVLALLAGGGYYAWQTWSAPEGSSAQLATAPVQRGDLEDVVTATGTLQPRDYVDVGTQVSGQLKKVHVAIGSMVKQGELLAEIDPTVYLSKVDADRAQLRNQQAQLTDKQSQLALARQQLTRQQNLMKEEATTREQLQTAEAMVRSATAQIEALRAQIEQTESTLRGDEASLGYTRIHAPISGTVVSQPTKQGQTLNANQQAPIVVRIADLSIMTVQAQVSEADVPKLRVGMDVYFMTLGGDSRRWQGKLRQIMPTPTVVNNVVLYDALFDVPNANRELMTQMTAQVFFVVASAKDALYVPVAALRPVGADGRGKGARRGGEGKDGRRGGAGGDAAGKGRPAETGMDPRSRFSDNRARVRVMKEDGRIEDRPVTLGMMNRVSAQVVSGLEPGERVVIGGRPAAQGAPKAGGFKMTPRL